MLFLLTFVTFGVKSRIQAVLCPIIKRYKFYLYINSPQKCGTKFYQNKIYKGGFVCLKKL